MKLRILAQDRPIIRFKPYLKRIFEHSVGRFPAETGAILAGYLEDPLTVTDFRPMPSAFDQHGRACASAGAFTLNVQFIEHFLNTELLPVRKYILGCMHSHPGDYEQLSGGLLGSDQGDIPVMRGHLEAAARLGKPWENYLAPIVTHPGANPTVTGWIVRRDEAEPIPAEVIWEDTPPIHAQPFEDHSTPEAVMSLLAPWQAAIKAASGDRTMTRSDRRHTVNVLRRVRDAKIRAFEDHVDSRRGAYGRGS